jgi:hypothetical protein
MIKAKLEIECKGMTVEEFLAGKGDPYREEMKERLKDINDNTLNFVEKFETTSDGMRYVAYVTSPKYEKKRESQDFVNDHYLMESKDANSKTDKEG